MAWYLLFMVMGVDGRGDDGDGPIDVIWDIAWIKRDERQSVDNPKPRPNLGLIWGSSPTLCPFRVPLQACPMSNWIKTVVSCPFRGVVGVAQKLDGH